MPVQVSYGQGGVELGGMGADLLVDPTVDLEIEVRVPAEWVAFVDDIALVTPEHPDGAGVMYYYDDVGAFVGLLPASDVEGYVYPRLVIDGGSWYGRSGCEDGGDNDDEQIWVSPSYIREVTGGHSELEGDEMPCTGAEAARGACEAGEAWEQNRASFVDEAERIAPMQPACNGVSGAGLTPSAMLLGAITLRRRRRSRA